MLPIKQAIKRRFTMPPQITCACALPDKIRKYVNCIFHSKCTGYAIQHIPVPVPGREKLEGLRQKGHPAQKWAELMEVHY